MSLFDGSVAGVPLIPADNEFGPVDVGVKMTQPQMPQSPGGRINVVTLADTAVTRLKPTVLLAVRYSPLSPAAAGDPSMTPLVGAGTKIRLSVPSLAEFPALALTADGPAGPVAPADPGAPGTPCKPASPLSPFGPCEPVWPAAPTSPLGPCGPAAPAFPCGPGVPCGPCGPCAPGSPCSPCGPIGPGSPCGPCGPGVPSSPGAVSVPLTARSPLSVMSPFIVPPLCTLRSAAPATIDARAAPLSGSLA
jgi:hypothetical protein